MRVNVTLISIDETLYYMFYNIITIKYSKNRNATICPSIYKKKYTCLFKYPYFQWLSQRYPFI